MIKKIWVTIKSTKKIKKKEKDFLKKKNKW